MVVTFKISIITYFENLTIELHILYNLNIHVKFCINRILFTTWSINLYFMHSFCKVEFNQPFSWLYSVPNLLVIQYLETLYLGGNHVKVVCERVWRKVQDCAFSKGLTTGSRDLQVAKGCTWVKHVEELNSHASWSTTGQKVQSGHSVSSRLGLATQSSHSQLSQAARSNRQTTLFGKNWLFTFQTHTNINTPYTYEM